MFCCHAPVPLGCRGWYYRPSCNSHYKPQKTGKAVGSAFCGTRPPGFYLRWVATRARPLWVVARLGVVPVCNPQKAGSLSPATAQGGVCLLWHRPPGFYPRWVATHASPLGCRPMGVLRPRATHKRQAAWHRPPGFYLRWVATRASPLGRRPWGCCARVQPTKGRQLWVQLRPRVGSSFSWHRPPGFYLRWVAARASPLGCRPWGVGGGCIHFVNKSGKLSSPLQATLRGTPPRGVWAGAHRLSSAPQPDPTAGLAQPASTSPNPSQPVSTRLNQPQLASTPRPDPPHKGFPWA